MSYKERKLKRKSKKLDKTFDQFSASRLASPDFGTTKMSRYEKRKFAKMDKTNRQINELRPKKIMDSGTFNNSSTIRMADAPTMSFELMHSKIEPELEPVRRIRNVSKFIAPENRLAEPPITTYGAQIPRIEGIDYRKMKK